MSKIEITPFEFKMILDGYHPEYNSSEDDGDFVENGKGADILYQKQVSRKIDNKVFNIQYLYNTDGGFRHDSPYDGDFIISKTKKDTLDPYNELKLNETKVEIETDNYNKSEVELLLEEIDNNKKHYTEFDHKNPTITPEDMKYIFDTVNNTKTLGEFKDMQLVVLKKAIEYKHEPESIRFTKAFTGRFYSKAGWLQKYTDSYNEKFNIKTDITIQGQKFSLSQKEVIALRKQLN